LQSQKTSAPHASHGAIVPSSARSRSLFTDVGEGEGGASAPSSTLSRQADGTNNILGLFTGVGEGEGLSRQADGTNNVFGLLTGVGEGEGVASSSSFTLSRSSFTLSRQALRARQGCRAAKFIASRQGCRAKLTLSLIARLSLLSLPLTAKVEGTCAAASVAAAAACHACCVFLVIHNADASSSDRHFHVSGRSPQTSRICNGAYVATDVFCESTIICRSRRKSTSI